MVEDAGVRFAPTLGKHMSSDNQGHEVLRNRARRPSGADDLADGAPANLIGSKHRSRWTSIMGENSKNMPSGWRWTRLRLA